MNFLEILVKNNLRRIILRKGAFFNYVDQILPIIAHLHTYLNIGKINMHTVDISRTTYLHRLVNVIKERPPKAIIKHLLSLNLEQGASYLLYVHLSRYVEKYNVSSSIILSTWQQSV